MGLEFLSRLTVPQPEGWANLGSGGPAKKGPLNTKEMWREDFASIPLESLLVTQRGSTSEGRHPDQQHPQLLGTY